MVSLKKIVENLEKLGLTPLQAKIYLLLVQTPKEKTLTISKVANTDRSNTYRTIIRLQRMGLVRKILGSPNTYQALPLQEAVTLLLNNKKEEYTNLTKTAEELQNNQLEITEDQQHMDCAITVENRPPIARLKAVDISTKTLENTLDMFARQKNILDGLLPLRKENLTCLKRGVRYRIITDKMNKEFLKNKLADFVAEPNFQLRYFDQESTVTIVILDKKLVQFTLQWKEKNNENFYFSNEKGLVNIFQSYFDKVWNEAKEYE